MLDFFANLGLQIAETPSHIRRWFPACHVVIFIPYVIADAFLEKLAKTSQPVSTAVARRGILPMCILPPLLGNAILFLSMTVVLTMDGHSAALESLSEESQEFVKNARRMAVAGVALSTVLLIHGFYTWNKDKHEKSC